MSHELYIYNVRFWSTLQYEVLAGIALWNVRMLSVHSRTFCCRSVAELLNICNSGVCAPKETGFDQLVLVCFQSVLKTRPKAIPCIVPGLAALHARQPNTSKPQRSIPTLVVNSYCYRKAVACVACCQLSGAGFARDGRHSSIAWVASWNRGAACLNEALDLRRFSEQVRFRLLTTG